ncbi:hypothetical protein TanjilG_24464 [Lupinus angustifolius]|uniref:Ribosomal protein L34Ae n=1 Tax=Lupinus angustifolius TaxID=3871 RepID=A0A1J7GWP0_LUPAN|nr:PREDICTED: uncharacterized protein LOC109356609 [Lupinus angustifolius]XP_019455563.1 PREDICTED: uncharacterized protein LOC109356609 [Lupinus angustifolius]OIW04992.1 hypothetical protein TanjilG_24464 [Lupinus angustifolius]
MDFLKIKKFIKSHKAGGENDLAGKAVPEPEEPKPNTVGPDWCKSENDDSVTEAEDDDDFITNEVKRRLKELRRNSFMVLIPEEDSCPEEGEDKEEAGETGFNEWRDVEAEGQQWWRGFDAVFEKYCERMLFFDRMSAQQLNEVGKGTQPPLTPSPRSASKKLASPFRCLSLKKIEEPDDEMEHLQQPENDPYQDIETGYVGHICLTWEALHSQYSHMSQKISWQPENPTCYNHSTQQFQQFQVLLQRFIENEPFEQGARAEIYARTRKTLPKLLQVPNIQGSDPKSTDESDMRVLAPDLIKAIESSILTFYLFLKRDKKKSSSTINLFGNQSQHSTPLHQVQSTLEKKVVKLKELRRKKKGCKMNCWPQKHEEIQLLLGLIDMKILSRVMRMTKISREQLFWCEEKMKKVDVSNSKLERDPCPILFPC